MARLGGASRAAGLAVFEAATHAYDLLLSDVIMLGPLNSKGLADTLMSRSPGMRVLFMSGYSEGSILQGRQLHHDLHLLTKPFRKIELAKAVHKRLDEDRETAR